MIKQLNKGYSLTQAVLTSTLLVSPMMLYANQLIGPGTYPGIPPVLTSTASENTIEVLGDGVTTAGQIQAAVLSDAVHIDNVGGKVIVDGNNTVFGFNAIETTGAGSSLIILGGATGGIIKVQPGSGMTTAGTGDAILIQANSARIRSEGMLQSTGTGAAIDIAAGGSGTMIHNGHGGVIQTSITSTTVGTIFTQAGATGLQLNNAGTITQFAPALDVLNLGENITLINNRNIIQNLDLGAGNAIHYTTGLAPVGTVNNQHSALLSVLGTGNAILTDAGTDIANLMNGGLIQSLGGGSAIVLNGDVGILTNAGQIFNNNANAGFATILGGPNTETVFSNIGTVTNAGGTGSIAIDFTGNTTFATINQDGGVINGNILLARADDGGGGNVFFMVGGKINGNVNALAAAPNLVNLHLDGGIVNGSVNLLSTNNDTINFGLARGFAANVIGSVNGGTGANIFTINGLGAGFGALNGGGIIPDGVNDQLIINTNFTGNGLITNIESITLNEADTVFTLNAPIINLDNTNIGTGITINSDTIFVDNSHIFATANITNHGTFIVNGNSNINLIDSGINGGTFLNNAGSLQVGSNGLLSFTSNQLGASLEFATDANYVVSIEGLDFPEDVPESGLILANAPDGVVPAVSGVIFNAGSSISPFFKGFLPKNSIFTVVRNIGGTITDGSVINQPHSAVISFIKLDEPSASPLTTTHIDLMVYRNTYRSLVDDSFTVGVAGALDVLAKGNGTTNQTLLSTLAQLDQLPIIQIVDHAIQSLAPPFNFSLVEGSRIGMNNVFEGITERLEELYTRHHHIVFISPSKHRHHDRTPSRGFNYGDGKGEGSAWIKMLGAHLDQNERDGSDGYTANAGGGSIGIDWGITNCITVGMAGSYTKVSVNDKNENPKDASIKSWQGTAYGWFEFIHGIYIDAMIGSASNNYNTNRDIQVGTFRTGAYADFDGSQWGAMTDLGWSAINDEIYFFAPFARLKWIQLKLNDYAEKGAGALNLNIANNEVAEFMGGVGFRIGSIAYSHHIKWVPELTAMIAYDFENDGEVSVASFLGAGPSFSTNGIIPGRTIVDLGFGINAYDAVRSMFTIKYNVELRDNFIANTGFLRWTYFL